MERILNYIDSVNDVDNHDEVDDAANHDDVNDVDDDNVNDDVFVNDDGRGYWPCLACLYWGILWQSKPLYPHFARSQCRIHLFGWGKMKYEDGIDNDDVMIDMEIPA